MYNSLECGDEAGDVTEEDVEVREEAGGCMGAEAGETMEEEVGAHAGSAAGEGVEKEETTEASSTASHGFVTMVVEKIRTAVWTLASGVRDVIDFITAPPDRVETADKACSVRKLISRP